MKFGQTYEQRKASHQEKYKKLVLGIKHFAWVPEQMRNGEWLWLEHYYAFHIMQPTPKGELTPVYTDFECKEPLIHLYQEERVL